MIYIFNFIIICFRLLPDKIIIIISKIIYFCLCFLIRYRSKTIEENIKNSFPELDKRSRYKLKKDYYKVISNYVTESMSFFAKGKNHIGRKLILDEQDTIDTFSKSIGPTILLSAHFGNWEVITSTLPTYFDIPVFGIYKPLNNKTIDKLVKEKRSQLRLQLIPMNDALRYIKKYQNTASLFVFISDQGPANMNNVVEVNFLNQRTPCLSGYQKIIQRFNLPAYYLKTVIEETSYHCTFQKLSSNAVVQEYMSLLEKDILRQPPYWLWSHKRWKRAHLLP